MIEKTIQAEKFRVLQLGLIPYRDAWELQKKLHIERVNGEIPDTLLLLQHPPVYTIGRHGNMRNITAGEDFLAQNGIEVVQVDRGGDVTYHGPGQIVGYPIFHLQARSMGVKAFVEYLQSILQKALREFGIESASDPHYPGLWVQNNKIAAIGIRVHYNVSMHGFALNVNPDLNHYLGIVACGIQQRGVTSMARLLMREISICDVKTAIIRNF
ncbi:MAG TPA: lipoyl(octanoyl) transferase LipB [Candidatus Marinimicrobia bacterium]|nr:lipoyl(octanoyl) transferase LipB [Candidatus Neomarinimicrobiota bacterium]